MQFELTDDIPRHFAPREPEFSHAVTAFMAALPYLEPYFIHNIREASRELTDPELKKEVETFIAQEARHAQQHRSLNQRMARHYPDLPRLEKAIKERLDRSRKRDSIAYRMAYTAGYETLTYHVVGFIMNNRHRWLADADPNVLAMLCWHGAEEVEHKSVAFDVFQAIHGGYGLRVAGFFAALVMTVRDIDVMLRYMLKSDGLWHKPSSQGRLLRFRLAMLRDFAPRVLGYFRPGYHPSQYTDPPAILRWIRRYEAGEDLRRMTLQSIDS